MWKFFAVTSFLCLFYLLDDFNGLAHPLPHPNISETFTATVHLMFQNILGQYTSHGEGYIYRDYGIKNQLITLNLKKFGKTSVTFYQLKRFDIREEFSLEFKDPREERHCIANYLNVFDEVWEWLKNAKFMGIVNFNGNMFEEWNSTDNRLSLLVNQIQHKIPVRYIANYTNNITIVDFKEFSLQRPNTTEFELPKICATPQPFIDDDY